MQPFQTSNPSPNKRKPTAHARLSTLSMDVKLELRSILLIQLCPSVVWSLSLSPSWSTILQLESRKRSAKHWMLSKSAFWIALGKRVFSDVRLIIFVLDVKSVTVSLLSATETEKSTWKAWLMDNCTLSQTTWIVKRRLCHETDYTVSTQIMLSRSLICGKFF